MVKGGYSLSSRRTKNSQLTAQKTKEEIHLSLTLIRVKLVLSYQQKLHTNRHPSLFMPDGDNDGLPGSDGCSAGYNLYGALNMPSAHPWGQDSAETPPPALATLSLWRDPRMLWRRPLPNPSLYCPQ